MLQLNTYIFRFSGMAETVLKHFVYSAIELLAILQNICLHLVYTTLKYMLNHSIKHDTSYEKSATIHHIIWKRRWIEIAECSPENFLTWPKSKVNPQYIFSPTVSLYAVTKDIVVFVETPEDIDIYRSDINPFLYLAQFKHSVQVITMPVGSLHQLAEELGDPSCQVILLSNTARSGSTIIGQVFESVPGTLLLSEPDVLSNIAYMRIARSLSDGEYEKLLTSVIRVMCKPIQNIERFCIKPRSCAVIHIEAVFRLFPTIKQLYLYRNVLESASSLLQISIANTTLKLMRFGVDSNKISVVFPHFRHFFIYMLGIQQEKQYKDPQDMDLSEIFITAWAQSVILAKQIKSCGNSLVTLKYEDLISNAHQTCTDAFIAVDIEIVEVENALAALKRDSQKGTLMGERSRGKDPCRHFSNSDFRKGNAILSLYSLPCLGEEFRI